METLASSVDTVPDSPVPDACGGHPRRYPGDDRGGRGGPEHRQEPGGRCPAGLVADLDGRPRSGRGEPDVQAGTHAAAFAEYFQEIYLAFHRRDGKRPGLSNSARSVLQHLAMAGPLTIGEAAGHLGRAQSVVSEIVDGLERKGLLERERDPADRRRTLVWLTDGGQAALHREHEVLALDRLTAAFARMGWEDREALLRGAAGLLAAGRESSCPAPQDRPDGPARAHETRTDLEERK